MFDKGLPLNMGMAVFNYNHRLVAMNMVTYCHLEISCKTLAATTIKFRDCSFPLPYVSILGHIHSAAWWQQEIGSVWQTTLYVSTS